MKTYNDKLSSCVHTALDLEFFLSYIEIVIENKLINQNETRITEYQKCIHLTTLFTFRVERISRNDPKRKEKSDNHIEDK